MKPRGGVRLLYLVWLAVGQVDCASSQPATKPVVVNAPVDDGAGPAAFARAKKSYDAGDNADAKHRFGEFLLKYPQRPEAHEARRLFAEAALKAGDARDAVEALRPLIKESAPNERPELLALLQRAATQAGDAGTLVEVLGTRLELADNEQDKQKLEQEILLAIDHDLPLPALMSLVEKVRKGSSPLAFAYETLLMKVARVARHVGDNARSEIAAKELIDRSPTGRFAAAAKALIAELAQQAQVKVNAVGVILPLTGSKKEFGRTSLEAIKLAFVGTDIELVVKDSKGDAQIAEQAAADLFAQEHVMAILGPLFSDESLAAAVRAEGDGVPMINLSQRDGIPQVGPSVFRLCLTPRQQADAIVKVAMETLGYKKFAVMYPNVSYGVELANYFWDDVEQKHGEIRGAETYDHDQTTFTVPVKKLVGRFWLEARSDYGKAASEIYHNKALSGMQRSHQLEATSKSLPPITDFDAIFIPDNSKEVGYIAPALAFEDVIVATDKEELKRIMKTTGRDEITPVRLLGGPGWNSQATVDRGGKFVEGAIFVDGFFIGDPDPRVQRFVKMFRDTLRSDPHLPDAQAYDAASIIAAGLAQHPQTRAALRTWLSTLKNFAGVTGKISFDPDGEATRDLYILTIERGQIVKFEAPKASG